MRLSEFLNDVGRVVSYYPGIRKITGSTTASILLCNLFYWSDKGHNEDGWIYKTMDELAEETGMSRDEIMTARKKLVERGLLEERNDRINHRMYYRVLVDEMNRMWEDNSATSANYHMGNPDFGKSGIPTSGNRDSLLREIGNPDFDIKETLDYTSITYNNTRNGKNSNGSAGLNTSVQKQKSERSSDSMPAELKKQIIAQWNACVADTPFPEIHSIGSARERHLKARLRENPKYMDRVVEVMEFIKDYEFLNGTKGYLADFDWAMKPDKLGKQYERMVASKKAYKPSPTSDDPYAGMQPWERAKAVNEAMGLF